MFQSGDSFRTQGMSYRANRLIRSYIVEATWQAGHKIAGCSLTLLYSNKCRWISDREIPQIGCRTNKDYITSFQQFQHYIKKSF